MIIQEYGLYVLSCDICGQEVDERFDTFQDAVDAKKEYNFTSSREGNDFIDVCEEC